MTCAIWINNCFGAGH